MDRLPPSAGGIQGNGAQPGGLAEGAVPHSGQHQQGGRRIAVASAILVLGFLASRLVGLLREVVLGAQFGTSVDYDLYLAAFRIPDVIFTLVAGGALGSALVPVFAAYRASGRGGGVERLAASVFNLVALAGLTAAAVGMVLAPWLAPLLFAGFAEPEQRARLVTLIRIMLLQPVFFGVGEVITRFLNVHHHFAYPAAAPVIYNLAIVGAALALGPAFGTVGLALGVTGGALLYLLVQLPAAHRLGYRWLPVVDTSDPGTRQIARLMLPRLVGQGAVQLSYVATTRLASFLPGGTLSALNYGWLLAMLPLGTFGMSVAGAAFPTLADQAARGDREALAGTVRRTLGSILFLMAPCATGLIAAGLPLVQVLFQRGAFTLDSSMVTAVALAMYALGLPAHGAIEILTRSFYALQDTRTPVVVGVLAMAMNVLLAYTLASPERYFAIALALSVSASVEAIILLVLLRRQLPGVLGPALVLSTTRTALACLALFAAAIPVQAAVRYVGLPPVLQLAAAVLAGGATYALAAFLLRSPELHGAIGLARRRIGR